MNRIVYSVFSAFLSMAILPLSAAAHVTANPNAAPADSWFRTALRVSHGCDGAATTEVRVTIPSGVLSVRPEMKPGWEITIHRRTLDRPVDGPHGPVHGVIEDIVWRGGPLPDAYFTEFGLSMRLPEGAGRTLYFPTVQTCESGANKWVQIPVEGESWGDLESPAPFVRLMPAAGGH